LARACSEHLDGTNVGTKEAEEERDGGGFSGPVGPEEGNRLTPADLETQVVESDPVSVTADDIIETQGQFSIGGVATAGGDTGVRTRP
jgi:hypothetical protein